MSFTSKQAENLRLLISQSKVQKVIEDLLHHAKLENLTLYEQVIQQSKKWGEMTFEKQMGTISYADADVKSAQIVSGLLYLIRELESHAKKQEKKETKEEVPIVIFTALPIEFTGVKYHLTMIENTFHPNTNTLYPIGMFTSPNGIVRVAVVQTEANNVKAAAEVERALTHFTPRYALFIGVAGGLKDVKLGDVVVGTKIYGFEMGKADKTYLPRFEFGEASYEMKQFARGVQQDTDWRKRIRPDQSISSEPEVFLSPVAAGDKVVSSTKSKVYRFLRKNCSDALAVAMEEYGFTESIKAHQSVEGLVIRGISDLIDQKKAADAAGSQGRAIANATAFGFELLAEMMKKGKIK